jgi:DNA modification methylase
MLIEKKPAFLSILCQDARNIALKSKSVDLILTSPAYWRKRDYKVDGQIGQEKTGDDFIKEFTKVFRQFKRILKPTGSLFLNVGDTYDNRSLADIPSRLMIAAKKIGFILRNRIIWVKTNGVPDPASNRLANRHEFIFHLVLGNNYYYDLPAYAERFGNGSNPGDVWNLSPSRNNSNHLAPFPTELVERILTLAAPPQVCGKCGKPFRREWRRTSQLNPNRPQAIRAMEIAKEKGLTNEHISAIQATGISDAGKALHFQTGAGRNSVKVQELAKEAKEILGGYFREFTFAKREAGEWARDCNCKASSKPGVVFDGFVGSGTTLRVALEEGFSAIGSDLKIYDDLQLLLKQSVS